VVTQWPKQANLPVSIGRALQRFFENDLFRSLHTLLGLKMMDINQPVPGKTKLHQGETIRQSRAQNRRRDLDEIRNSRTSLPEP
jgi:hypothetical protein